jgi:hypothetical protein
MVVDALEWQGCNDPDRMLADLRLAFHKEEWTRPDQRQLHRQLQPLRQSVSLRKMRLILCACGRRVWDQMTEEQSRQAVELGEEAADRKISNRRLDAQLTACRMRAAPTAADFLAGYCVVRLKDCYEGVSSIAISTRLLMSALMGDLAGSTFGEWLVWRPNQHSKTALAEPSRITCDLLREVLGNPLGELAFPQRWPVSVQGLARALYEGEDCRLPLRDALLDADQVELADHFQQPWHPRGCWVLDVLLGKK